MNPSAYACRAALCLALCGSGIGTAPADEPAGAIRVPAGFRVVEFAGDALVHDAFSLTHDAQGRAVVSGPGYVRRLEDLDGDGRAERSTTLWNGPASGAQGLCFVERELWYTGDGGLWRLSTANADGVIEGPPKRIAELANPEHGAHQIVQGPDGWLYVVCGNDAGVTASHVRSDCSPVRQPQGGAILRFTVDGQRSEIVADGFRNPYDLAFAADGRLFTVDSDGERDQYLPWYAPTRTFDVVIGARHGWVNGGWTKSWSQPDAWFDNAPRFAELGRGSPTGAVVYRHQTFPERYRGGLFTACWTLGRVYFVPLSGAGPTDSEVFLEATGHSGLAPVDLEVGPEGDLWLAIGGRGTRGGVFRIHPEQAPGVSTAEDELTRVLQAPQPLSAWSRRRWLPPARSQGPAAFTAAAADRERTVAERVRAIEILTECWDGLGQAEAERLSTDAEPVLVARLAWSLGRGAPEAWKSDLAARLTGATDPRVSRAAWETVAQLPGAAIESTRPDWSAGLTADSRSVRQALLGAARALPPDQVRRSLERDGAVARLRAAEIDALTGRSLAPDACLAIAREIFADSSSRAARPEAVRLLQLALGDLWTGAANEPGASPAGARESRPAGYSAARTIAAPSGLGGWLLEVFPSGDEALDQELARLAGQAKLDREDFFDRLTEKWTDGSSPDADLHYLFVAAELPAVAGAPAIQRMAQAIARLHDKLDARAWRPSRNWPEHVAQLVTRLIEREPRLAPALAARDELRWPDQAVYCTALDGASRDLVARRLLPALAAAEHPAPGEAWELLAGVPLEEIRPALAAQAERFGVTQTILSRLAEAPTPEDRPHFVAGINALDPHVVALAAKVLAREPAPADDADLADAVAALRRWSLPPLGRDGQPKPIGEAERGACRTLSALLAQWSGQREIDRACAAARYQPAACAAWFEWFATTATGRHAADTPGSSRWQSIDWSAGDAVRGREVFARASCLRCHEGDSRLGPELRGAAQRLSRGDLLTSIIDPHREVSPVYRLKRFETTDGRVYQGQVIYESPEATLVQVDGETSVRLRAEEIAVESESPLSLMPAGLLDRLDDGAVADLLAYLASLSAAP